MSPPSSKNSIVLWMPESPTLAKNHPLCLLLPPVLPKNGVARLWHGRRLGVTMRMATAVEACTVMSVSNDPARGSPTRSPAGSCPMWSCGTAFSPRAASNCRSTCGVSSCLRATSGPKRSRLMQDVLRASLLIHVLLKQHRCVTEVSLDHYITVVEKYVLLDALKTGAEGVKRLVYKQAAIDIICQIPLTSATVCSEAIASMTNVTYLNLSNMWFSEEDARMIGGYVEKTTSLTFLDLEQIEADDKGAGIFLDHLSRNRSLKTLHMQEHFLLERKGRALADAIRNHATLEELKVKGSKDESPSALLIAAAQSRSLRSLILLESFIDAAHIKVMASALTIPSLPAEFEALTVRPPPMSRLQKLSLSSCKPFHSDMEAAYAKLIGGALVELTLSDCGLGEVFASHASERLLHDRRLNLLNVETNLFSVNSLQSMIKSLETNKTLKTLVVSLTTAHSEEDISPLFETMRQVNAFSRMWLHWKNPWPSDLANSLLTARTLSVSIKLDDYKEVDAAVTLGAIARHRSFDAAEIECSKKVEPAVLHILADALARTKSLQHLVLNLSGLPDADVVNLFRALESNRTVFTMVLNAITFSKRNAKAFGRLVECNRSLVYIHVNLQRSDPNVDRMVQFHNICREVKEALRRNRFILNVSARTGYSNPSNDPAIKAAIRQNSVLISQSLRFVTGSMEKTDAMAFETLQHCQSLVVRLHTYTDASI
nr:uncharacterized protein LOC119163135 isoform X1 [Rhipicephalus microplus]